MSLRLSGINPLAYMGVEPYTPPALVIQTAQPTVNDFQNFNIGTFWLILDPQELWYLASVAGGVATWIQLYPSTGTSSFVTNSGTAMPISGVLNVLGDGTFITTSGSGNTVTISLAGGGFATQFDTDSGTATPSAGILNVFGDTTVTTSGAGNTVTIHAGGDLATTYNANSGSATPSGHVLNLLGANVVETIASGNTVTTELTNGTNGQVIIGGGSAPIWANLTAGANITITNAANSITIASTGGGGGGGTVITTFTSSGTWTPNGLTQFVIVYGWNGGAGGGSGSFGGGASGGGGGTGGNAYYQFGPIDFFYSGTPIVVTIGAGGTGGAGVTLGTGNNGGASGQTSIGNLAIPVSSSSAGLGNGTGGTSGSRAYVLANGYILVDGTEIGGNGGAVNGDNAFNLDSAAVTGSTPSAFASPYMCASSGGGGGGTGSGGNGGNISIAGSLAISGGAGGSTGNPGSPGTAAPSVSAGGSELLTGGTGGGGGGGAGGAGGIGGLPGGGGGGGGAASSGTSGAGGNGAGGMVVFVEIF